MLYLVSTPIGNLSELTKRAVEVLSSADFVYSEDTRHSLVLLNHYQIKAKLVSYQKFNERERAIEIVEKLKEGKTIALISDAGTPLISDPGNILIKELIKNELPFTHISGACALVSALVLSGLSTQKFYFAGFLPEKQKDKKELIEEIRNLKSTLVFYVAVHDVEKTLSFLFEQLGSRKFSLVRELTKKFEEVIRGKLGEEINFTKKGEFVLVVEGKTENENETKSIPELYENYLQQGLDKKAAMKEVAKAKGISKSEIYQHLVKLEEKSNVKK
ncbi:MAG: 16S rRNA (cytidine(1402)-2'-O)-methyltransferase [Firmicutes bacterium]|nr:16S rRNA (cytidine(1402)-2'-O)-methyltransferase [Bacillota bacterium]